MRGKGCFTNFGSNRNKAYTLDENFSTKGTKVIGAFDEDSIYLSDNEQHYIVLHKPDNGIYDNLEVNISTKDNNIQNNYPITLTPLANAYGNETYSFLIDTTNNNSGKKLGYIIDKNNNKTPRQNISGDGYYSRYKFYEPEFNIDNTNIGKAKDLTWSKYEGNNFKGDYFEKSGTKYYYTFELGNDKKDTVFNSTEELKLIKDIESSCIEMGESYVKDVKYYFPYLKSINYVKKVQIGTPGGIATEAAGNLIFIGAVKQLDVDVKYKYYVLRNGKIILI